MALEMKCVKIYKEEDGRITVNVDLIESEDGTVLGRKTFQGTTKEELKNMIRPVWQKMKTNYDNHPSLLAIANEALDEIEAEVF